MPEFQSKINNPNQVPIKTSFISLAKVARNNYKERPTRDLNGSEGLIVRTLGSYQEGIYVGIYFDTKRNIWTATELQKARESLFKYKNQPTPENLVEVGFKISDINMQRTILIEFKNKRPDKDFGYGIEPNYSAALMTIESELEALYQQAETLKISKKIINDLGKLKYSLRSNNLKNKAFENEMGVRFIQHLKNTLE